jgi:hypothetical protein
VCLVASVWPKGLKFMQTRRFKTRKQIGMRRA